MSMDLMYRQLYEKDKYEYDDDYRSYPYDEDDDALLPQWLFWTLVIVFYTTSFGIIISLCWNIGPTLYWILRSKIPVSKKAIRKRYETIECWSVNKRVRAHCRKCEILQAGYGVNRCAPDTELSDPDTLDANDDDEQLEQPRPQPASDASIDDSLSIEVPECPICMDTFRAGEIATWSSNPKCSHAFHHECIKEWLLRRARCPCCREIFLPTDEVDKKKMKVPEMVHSLITRLTCRMMTTYFCERDGLVVVQRHCGRNNHDHQIFREIAWAHPVSRAELALYRGRRAGLDLTEQDQNLPILGTSDEEGNEENDNNDDEEEEEAIRENIDKLCSDALHQQSEELMAINNITKQEDESNNKDDGDVEMGLGPVCASTSKPLSQQESDVRMEQHEQLSTKEKTGRSNGEPVPVMDEEMGQIDDISSSKPEDAAQAPLPMDSNLGKKPKL